MIGAVPAQASDLVLQRRRLHLRANGCLYVRVTDHGPAQISGTLRVFWRVHGHKLWFGHRKFVVASQGSRVVCLRVRRALRPKLAGRRIAVTVLVTFTELQLQAKRQGQRTLIVARRLR
jgi:hypothetical protein